METIFDQIVTSVFEFVFDIADILFNHLIDKAAASFKRRENRRNLRKRG